MTHVEFARDTRQGASRVRRTAKVNPLEFMISMVEADPEIDKEDLRIKWGGAVDRDKQQLEAVKDYVFAILHEQLHRSTRKKARAASSAAEQAKSAEQRAAIERTVEQVMLLNSLCPNGKILRHNTAPYGQRVGRTIDRACTKLIKRSKTKLLNEITDEKEFRRLGGWKP